MAELLERAGPKPPGAGAQPRERAEALGFWAGCLLPLGPGEQQSLLAMTDSAQRLRCATAASIFLRAWRCGTPAPRFRADPQRLEVGGLAHGFRLP